MFLKLWPNSAPYADVDQHGFLGLSTLGWVAFIIMWVLQGFVFWRGMAAIRRFIDFCGPAVYVVMVALAIHMVARAGWSNISFTLSDKQLSTGETIGVLLGAIAIAVSYFSGPTLNFGDIARYGRTMKSVRLGNFLGLPINFLFFSLLVVITASATVPVYGELIDDPVATMERIDNLTAVILGVLTLIIATVGINIVANFIAPAFDFSTIWPQHVSWRAGGMIAAVGSVLLTPCNLYNNPEVIHYTLETLGSFIGPLFGVLLAFYYGPAKQRVKTDDLFTLDERGKYWYRNGFNPNAVTATIVGAVLAIVTVMIPALKEVAQYSWFIGAGVAALVFTIMEKVSPQTAPLPTDDELAPTVRVDGGVAHG